MVLVDLRARLEIARRWYPAMLGDPTILGPRPIAEFLANAFMLLFPAMLLWSAFSSGPIWIGVVCVTALAGIGVLATCVPHKLRARRWKSEAQFATFALVEVDPLALDPSNKHTRACYGVISFDPALEEHPRRLASIADAVRAALAEPASEPDPAPQRFLSKIRPRIEQRLSGARGLVVPRRLAGEAEARFVEVRISPNLLPNGSLDSGLFFLLALPKDAAGDMICHVQSDALWGPGAASISSSFPLILPRATS